jgi:type I restriction enzyme S subunit
MKELPIGWKVSTIRELSDIVTKGTTPKTYGFQYQAQGVRFVKAECLSGGRIQHELCSYISEHAHQVFLRSQLCPGDVLFTIAGTLGRVAVVHESDVPANTNQAVAIIRLFNNELARYVAAYLNSAAAKFAEAEGRGIGLQNLNLQQVKDLAVLLPPLIEQRRIVAKIDSLFAKSKRARDNLDRIPGLAKKYKQAMLEAAFRGDLTGEWRISAHIGDEQVEFKGPPKELDGRPLPSSWAIKPISEAAINHDGKRVPVRASDRARRRGEFPYYGASGIIDTIDDYLFDGDFLLIGEDGANLISRSTPIAFLASGRYWVNNHAHVLQAGPELSNSWLCWYINMIDLTPFVTGTAQPKLTQAALNSIVVPIPSVAEQQQILRLIKTAFARIDRLASETTSARNLLDRLDREVLTKAFRGELVPQNLNDEPASVLLDRIKAQRQTKAPHNPKTRRATGSRAESEKRTEDVTDTSSCS